MWVKTVVSFSRDDTYCMYDDTYCMYVDTYCMYVDTYCMYDDTYCMYLSVGADGGGYTTSVPIKMSRTLSKGEPL